MDFRTAPKEQRNGGTFFTREAEAALVDDLIRREADLLDRLKSQ